MKKETYIQLRKTNNTLVIVYNHYYETSVAQGKIPMDYSKFAEWFPQYIGAQHIIESVINNYDKEYGIVLIEKINVQMQVIAIIDVI